eukprot:gene17954-24358_t
MQLHTSTANFGYACSKACIAFAQWALNDHVETEVLPLVQALLASLPLGLVGLALRKAPNAHRKTDELSSLLLSSACLAACIISNRDKPRDVLRAFYCCSSSFGCWNSAVQSRALRNPERPSASKTFTAMALPPELNLSNRYEQSIIASGAPNSQSENPYHDCIEVVEASLLSLTPRHPHELAVIPAVIITGFLGSGKTTLVRHVLRNRSNLRLAVLVNEVGAVDVDSQLVDLKQVSTPTDT